MRVPAGPLRGAQPSHPGGAEVAEAESGRACPRRPRPAHAGPTRKGEWSAPRALGQRGAAASAFTKGMASMLHFPELGKCPTRSAWAVNTGSAITSSLEIRRDREAGMSTGSRARRREGRRTEAT